MLSEAELCAEIALVKQQLTVQQCESLTANADAVHGNCWIAEFLHNMPIQSHPSHLSRINSYLNQPTKLTVRMTCELTSGY